MDARTKTNSPQQPGRYDAHPGRVARTPAAETGRVRFSIRGGGLRKSRRRGADRIKAARDRLSLARDTRLGSRGDPGRSKRYPHRHAAVWRNSLGPRRRVATDDCAVQIGRGGRLGTGRQWMSWVALDDAIGIIRFAIANARLRGPLNVVAPNPVRDAEFADVVATVLRRPAIFRAPAFVLRLRPG